MGHALTATLEDDIGKLEYHDGVIQFLLLRENRNWNILQEDCEQALVSGTREGQLGYMRMLLDAELNVDTTRDYDGATSLIRAIDSPHGSSEAVKLLLEAGADPEDEGSQKAPWRAWIPLVLATNGNNHGIIKLLVEYGADLEMVGCEEVFTAPEYTVHKEKVECIQVLLELGADPRGCMPFDLSKAKQSEPYRIVAEALEVVKGTPLEFTVKWGRPFQVLALLESGVDPNTCSASVERSSVKVKKGSFRKAQQLYHDETLYQAYLDEMDEIGYACYDSDDPEA